MNIISNKNSIIEIINNQIHIICYKSIGVLSNNFISIKLYNNNVIISGNNLIISKMTQDELLICGEYNEIKFEKYN